MAKNKWGKFVALATAAGAVAAGISYFMKYKSFNKELDEDFHDFEGDEDEFDGTLPHETETPERTYVTLGEKKTETADEVKEAAKETAEDVAATVKDAAAEISETVKEEVSEAAKETADATTIEEDTAVQ